MRAMVLTAGRGTRLWPLTAQRPKASLPLGGRWLVEHVLDWLEGHGVDEATLNLHHRGEVLRARLGPRRGRVALRYSDEPELLGTGGALDPLRGWLAERGTFVVVNGKLVTEVDLGAARAAHRRHVAKGALATLVLRKNPDPARYTQVLTAQPVAGEPFGLRAVRGFVRPGAAPKARVFLPPLLFTGIALVEPALLERVPRGRASDVVSDVYEPLLAAGGLIAAVVDEALWLEPSTRERYLEAALALAARAGARSDVAESAWIDPQARVEASAIGERARIEAGAVVEGSIVGEGVVVRAGALIRNEALAVGPDETLLRRVF
jgi:NDP-sugar pyrophosphorylase family protein